MAKPRSAHMPDLSALTTQVMLAYILNITLRGAGVSDYAGGVYLTGFIRMVDKAVFEYEAARVALEQYVVSENRTSLILRSVAHLETCINSIHRALNFVDRMKQYQAAPDIERVVHKTLSSHRGSIPRMRNAIEHMDEWIANGEVRVGEPVAIEVNEQGDAISISTKGLSLECLSFQTLATLLRRLHALAMELADYHEPTSWSPG